MPFLTHSNVELFFTDSGGTGPPILLLHGWACDSHDWSFQIPFLVSLGMRVIALDHRGHGRSSIPTSVDLYKMQDFVGDVVALINHIDAGPVILMPHSMSTIISSLVAVEHPDLVKALVLVHPIYGAAPPQLRTMGETLQKEPGKAVSTVINFFSALMYTPNTPLWLKTWQLRRLEGCHPAMLAGCVAGLVDLFGTVMGSGEVEKTFMRRRKGPRFVMCTLPQAKPWEDEVGVGQEDVVWEMQEGVFSHMVESDKFNEELGRWLTNRGLAAHQ
ncbi:alpha/beta-hydrolase [Polyplosphaeria fusca]|uniref:Alpha/beta-hydrolase n=1 Tax=Polyplosphaeria fusca TaxID=682080 RepID=A0A9P4UWE9_9PLEO|nr:alpha/beta-hydrolase [Polyplosphaeria fusca]